MNRFLWVYGVDESMISPFCKAFGIVSELRDRFLFNYPPRLQQQQQQKEKCIDTVKHFGWEIIVEWMPDI